MIIRNSNNHNSDLAINTDLVSDYFKGVTSGGRSAIHFYYAAICDDECKHEAWAFDTEHERDETFENIMTVINAVFV